MFMVTKLKVVIAVVVAAFVLIGVIIALADLPMSPESVAEKYLTRTGWQFTKPPVESVSFEITPEWDKVYENYNELQKQAGFDLSPYKGKLAQRITYYISNFWGVNDVRANIIVSNGKVIGGDISTVAIDGFMIPLELRSDVESSGIWR